MSLLVLRDGTGGRQGTHGLRQPGYPVFRERRLEQKVNACPKQTPYPHYPDLVPTRSGRIYAGSSCLGGCRKSRTGVTSCAAVVRGYGVWFGWGTFDFASPSCEGVNPPRLSGEMHSPEPRSVQYSLFQSTPPERGNAANINK